MVDNVPHINISLIGDKYIDVGDFAELTLMNVEGFIDIEVVASNVNNEVLTNTNVNVNGALVDNE
jgi:hypothetical protein